MKSSYLFNARKLRSSSVQQSALSEVCNLIYMLPSELSVEIRQLKGKIGKVQRLFHHKTTRGQVIVIQRDLNV